MIVFKEVFKKYRQRDIKLRGGREEKEVLKGLSFQLQEREILGLVGLNGEGKTTTIKLIIGVLRADKGLVKVLGQRPGNKNVKKRIGYLPENPSFYPMLKAMDILKFVKKLRGGTEQEIEELLKRVRLWEVRHKKIGTFSKGMVQRLGLAQAFIGSPELVILDEPLSGLDPAGRRMAKELIKDANDKGISILFTSHILEDIEEISHRVLILHQGRIRREVRSEELRIKGNLEKIFLETVGLKNELGNS